MSSPPKKMRKSGGGASVAPVQAEPVSNPSNDVDMDEDLDPAAMYEDEEGWLIFKFEGFIDAIEKKIGPKYGESMKVNIFDVVMISFRWLPCWRYLYSTAS